MKLLLTGDSLVEYGDWLNYLPDFEIQNFGAAGETVHDLLTRNRGILAVCAQPEAIIVMIGTNNLLMEDFDFMNDYGRIIDDYKDAFPAAEILITSLLPLNVDWLADSAIRRMNASLTELSQKKQVTYLDLYQAFLSESGRPRTNLFSPDGVHLSESGYHEWAMALIQHFNQA